MLGAKWYADKVQDRVVNHPHWRTLDERVYKELNKIDDFIFKFLWICWLIWFLNVGLFLNLNTVSLVERIIYE